MERSSAKTAKFVFFLIIVFGIVAGVFFLLKGKNNLLSPVPLEPNFKVVFQTPTPDVSISPQSPTPSPKGGKTVVSPSPVKATPVPKTPTLAPTKTISITPTKVISPTPTKA